jgi:hypothetical protein
MRRGGLMVLALAGVALVHAGESPQDARQHDFGEVLQGEVVRHAFVLRNDRGTTARITGVQASDGLAMSAVPVTPPADGERSLPVTLDTRRISGPVSASLAVTLDDGGSRQFELVGRVKPPMEVLPRPAFFVSTQKGAAKQATLELINHEPAPVTLSLPTQPADGRYRLALQELEPGRRFRLVLTVSQDAPPGRFSEFIALASSSAIKPKVPLGVNLQVRERVYTFPDAVDFGTVRLSDLKTPSAANTQTLMVYQTSGQGFSATPAVEGLAAHVAAEAGSQGDRVQVTLSLPPTTAPGPLRGTVVLRTNDPQFSRVTVPVTGQVVE